jgi:predicted ATPase
MIRSIGMTNFKCFKEQILPLRALTLLTGINGMGKSTVIQSLLLLRQSNLQGMLPNRGLLVNGDLIDLGAAGDILYRGADTDELGIRLDLDGIPLKWRFRYANQYDNVLPVLEEPNEPLQDGPFQRNFHYLMAERIGPRAMYEMSAYAVQQEQRIGRDGRYAIAYLEANRTREVTSKLRLANESQSNARAQIEAWLSEISPGTHLDIHPYPELGRLTMGMTFGAQVIKGRPFSAPNVGFGLSYVLPVLVALLATPPNALVLVENPEAHLNPKGQVAMGHLLALAGGAGAQLIVETHSDHVLNGIRIAIKRKEVEVEQVAIHYFDRKISNDQPVHVVYSPEIDSNGRIENWPTGFFDQWEQSLDVLLS